jgi:hypothetical protein
MKDRALRQARLLATTGGADDLAAADAGQLDHILKQAGQADELTAELLEEVAKRLEAGTVTSQHLYRVLSAPDDAPTGWRDRRDRAFDYVMDYVGEAKQFLNLHSPQSG